MSIALALAGTLPWLLAPAIAALRMRGSRTLDAEPPAPPSPAPLVTVVVPARDEARNVGPCLRSVLAADYPALEVVLVDDHSRDGTGDIARAIAAGDPRLRVLANPELPPGWFGKQWACANGARVARGEILLFADADTRHAPDLVSRAVHAMRSTGADLLSVAGRQEMHTLWERLVQPQVFAMLAARFGGTRAVERARRPEDVIANGQCLLVRRDVYESLGGHEAVRDNVAEDLAIAQRFFRAGKRVRVVIGLAQLSTRMYESFAELVRGWRKNLYAGGRHAVPYGVLGRAIFPLLLVLGPLFTLAPVVGLALGALGVVSAAWTLWGAVAYAVSTLWWAAAYHVAGESAWHAPLHPLGALVLLYIVVGAIARGRRVEWKGRTHVSR